MSTRPTVPALNPVIDTERLRSYECSCAFWRRRSLPPSTPVYINSEGEAMRFSARLARRDITMARMNTIAHLNNHIDAVSHEAEIHSSDVRRVIEDSTGISLNEEDTQVITVDLLNKINNLIDTIVTVHANRR